MKKLKVVTVEGTRPEKIRLACGIPKRDQHCEHILLHTGQNYDYELNEIFFNDLGIRKPDYFLGVAGGSAAETIGNVIIGVDKALAEVKPEAMLVLGDTNSCMAVLSAKRRKIPTFHMEAGNRCFDQRVPEEINRRLVDHMADINLTYSSIARDYLLREGLPADMVIKTGSPMFEVLNTYRQGIESSDVLERLGLQKHKFFVVSAHREENVYSDKNFSNLVESLNTIAETYQMPVIVYTHTINQKRVDEMGVQLNT
jgi:UDP-N-acetylglucosamine 2-epimerase (non-hydrolysing)